MKNIQQNKTKIQNIPNSDTVKRINKIAKTFKSARRGNRASMLNALATEINQTQNTAVRNWLVRFDGILRSMEVAK